MFSALEFSGYEVSAHWDSGGHSGKNGGLIFKEVMRWLWAGWPAPVEPGISQNATLSDILEPGEGWECIGNAPDEGRLHACSDTSVILRCGRSSYALSRSGYMEKVRKTSRQDPMTAVYPGSGQLAEALAGSSWVWNYILDGSGRKTYGQEYYYLHSAPYQITFDTKGYLYAATDTGVQICDHNGRVRAILAPPVGPVKSVAFAGNDIFVISGGRIYVRRLRRCGFTDAAGTPEPEREPQG